MLLLAEINGLPVEKPLEFGVQRGIAGHLAGQDQTLARGDVQTQGWNHDPGGVCMVRTGERKTSHMFVALKL